MKLTYNAFTLITAIEYVLVIPVALVYMPSIVTDLYLELGYESYYLSNITVVDNYIYIMFAFISGIAILAKDSLLQRKYVNIINVALTGLILIFIGVHFWLLYSPMYSGMQSLME